MSRTRLTTSERRLTIGLITNQVHTRVFEDQWQGVADAAAEMDVNLVVYPGSALKSPYGFEKKSNLIFDLIQPSFFDGLIIWTGALNWYVSEKEMNAFVKRYAGMPLVSMEVPLAGCTSITVGNYQGMWDLVEHLLVVHGYRRLAFVSGPAGHGGVKTRFQGYCDCLAAHGVAFDANLVVDGNFSRRSGETAVSILLDDRHADFEAIVAANDKMAWGAMLALQARDITVPLHKAVVGFDHDQTTFPPLTTVCSPFYEMGRLALETCVALVNAQDVPQHLETSAKLTIKRSCGCLPDSPFLLDNPPLPISDIVPDYQRIATAVTQQITSPPPLEIVERLTQSFVESVNDAIVDPFLAQVDAILMKEVASGNDLAYWYQIILALRISVKHYWRSSKQSTFAEDLCHEARLLITDTERWNQEYKIVLAEETTLKLRQIGEMLISAFGMEEVKDLISERFPEIGVRQCAVALYRQDSVNALEVDLLVIYDENGRCAPDVTLWNLEESVLPPLFLNREKSQAFLVSPLYFRDEDLGVVIFGLDERNGTIYETLRIQLSSALKQALMVKEIQGDQNELELRVATRTAELMREAIEHKQTAEALQKSETTTLALLEAIPDAIFLVDEDLRFLNFMPSEGMKTAVDQLDYLGMTLADVFPPHLAQIFKQTIPHAAHTKTVFLEEYQVGFAHDIRYYEARLLGLGNGHVLGIIRDITERKYGEEERELLITELEAKNAELEQFTYTVSHDLKSPLVTIKGFLGFLEQDVMEGNTQQLKTDIMRIHQAAEQMQSLLDDLLELSRVGHSINSPEAVPFAEIVQEAVNRVSGQIQEKQVGLLIQLDLPIVKVDKVRLVEVIQNLLDNAVKYMGKQTQPTISVGTEIRQNETLFFVLDNGLGIDARYHEKVFGLFDRLEHDEEGTGIGLALVKRIIELHNGRIWVESAGKGQGSTFYFTLPLAETSDNEN